MLETLAVTDAITDIHQARQILNLQVAPDKAFFPEWQLGLPDLSELEKVHLDRLRDRYLYYAADGSISEGTINTVMIAPLLELLGFLISPLKFEARHLSD